MDYLTIDYTAHTKECQDNKACSLGWLIYWSNEHEILEPWARSFQCHIYETSKKSIYGAETDGIFYWSVNYPEYLSIYNEPPEVAYKNEIKGIIAV